MKKKRLLIVGIVAALLLTGVAYAAWTASADVRVNAKSGEMDVEITDTAVVKVDDYIEFSAENIVVSDDKKTATVTFDNMYPGSEVIFTVNVENTGTIPVSLTKLTHEAIAVLNKENNANYGLNAEIFKYFNAEYTIAKVDEKGKVSSYQKSVNTEKLAWVDDIYEDNKLPDIEPGESVQLKVRVYLDKAAENNTENKLFKFSITPVFGQAN